MPADSLLPRRRDDVTGIGLFEQQQKHNGSNGFYGDSISTDAHTKTTMEQTIPATAISPDQDRHQQQQQPGFDGNNNNGIDRFETRHHEGDGGKQQQTMSIIIRESQLDRMGMVSPDGSGDVASSDNTAMDEAHSHRKTDKEMKMAAPAVAVLPPMVTPMATVPTAAAAAAATATRPSTEEGGGARKTLFHTPQKTTMGTPATPYMAPFLPNYDQSATSNNSNNNNNNKNDNKNASYQFSSNKPPPYSPVTPNTISIMSTISPFKSSMQLLDEKLSSVLKLESRIDHKIMGVSKELEFDDSLIEEEDESVDEGISESIKDRGKKKKEEILVDEDEEKENSYSKVNESRISIMSEDIISELSSADTEGFISPVKEKGQMALFSSVASSASRCASRHDMYTDRVHDETMLYPESSSKNGTTTSPPPASSSEIIEMERHLYDIERRLHTIGPSDELNSRQYDSDSESYHSRHSHHAGRPRSASLDSSSCASSSKDAGLQYLLEKEGLDAATVSNGKRGRHRTPFTINDTTIASSATTAPSTVKVRRVLWSSGDDITMSRGGRHETERLSSSYDYLKNEITPSSSYASPLVMQKEHKRSNSRRGGSKSAKSRSKYSPPYSTAASMNAPLTYPTKYQSAQQHHSYHQQHHYHHVRYHPYDHHQYHHQGSSSGSNNLVGTGTPLAPKQLSYPSSRIDEMELSSSSSSDDGQKSNFAVALGGKDDSMAMMPTAEEPHVDENEAKNIQSQESLVKTDLVSVEEQQPPATSSSSTQRNSRNFVGGMFKRIKGNSKRNHQQTNSTSEASVHASSNTIDDNITVQSNLHDQTVVQDVYQQHSSSDAHVSALLQQLNQITNERTQLLNMVSDLRQQLTSMSNDRKTLISANNASTKKKKRYKNEVRTLESELSLSIRLVQEVQEISACREEEVNGLRQLLKDRNLAYEELISKGKEKEEEWNIQLALAEQQREEDVERITSELNQRHLNELEKTKSDLLVTTSASHALQLEQLESLHSEEMERVRAEMEASLAEQARQLSSSHADELQRQRCELEQSSKAEVERLHSQAEKVRMEEVERMRKEMEASAALALEGRVEQLSTSHAAEVEEMKAELLWQQQLAAEELKRVRDEAERQRLEDVTRVRQEMETSAALAMEERVKHMTTSHASELNALKTELEQSSKMEIERVRNEAERQRMEEMEVIRQEMKASITAQLSKSHAAELDALRDDWCEEIERVRNEAESQRLEDIDRIRRESEAALTEHHVDTTSQIEEPIAEHQSPISPEVECVQNGAQDIDCMPQEIDDDSIVWSEDDHSSENEEEEEDYSSEDEAFYIGKEEGFLPSESVVESDISETASEEDDNDVLHESYSTNESSSQQEVIEASYVENDTPSLAPSFNEWALHQSTSSLTDLDHIQNNAEKQLLPFVMTLALLMDILRSQMEASASQALESKTKELAESHSMELNQLRSDLEASFSIQLQQIQSAAEERCKAEVEVVTDDLAKLHSEEMESLRSSHADRLNQLTASHEEDLAQVINERDDVKDQLDAALAETESRTLPELNQKLTALANEKENLVGDNRQLTGRIDELESDLRSKCLTTSDLEKSVSIKDEEIQDLHAKLMNKTGMLLDLRQENEQLSNELAATTSELKSRIEELQSEIDSLKEVRASLQVEKEASSKLRDQLQQTKEALLEVQEQKLSIESCLDEMTQDKIHLSTETENLHDQMSLLSNEVTSLENQIISNEAHIRTLESQLASKVDEAEALNTTVISHEATLDDLRCEVRTVSKQKAEIEETLSSLHGRMDRVMGERDDLATQLDNAAKELESVRTVRHDIAAKMTDISIVQNSSDGSFNGIEFSPSGDLGSMQNEDSLGSRNDLMEILNLSCISEEDADLVCKKMSKVQSIITQIEGERKRLKKEVKHLRAGLEKSQEELAVAKEEYKEARGQTLALRDVVREARSLLEKTDEEKNQLVLDLENAHNAMKRIKENSSKSYNQIVSQSQDEINKLKLELRQKNESIECLISSSMEKASDSIDTYISQQPNEISKFDISTDTAIISNTRANNNNFVTPNVKSTVKSKDRYSIEKGSGWKMLKDLKRSGRKEKVKYRKQVLRENEFVFPPLSDS